MKTYIKIALALVVIIAVGGILAALYLYNLKPKDLNKVTPRFIVTATDFQKSFEDNEKASSEKYINKIIEVSGEISSVKRGEKNSMNVMLKTGSELSSIICTFPHIADTTAFRAGNQITLRGECSGYLMDVLLNNCAVVK